LERKIRSMRDVVTAEWQSRAMDKWLMRMQRSRNWISWLEIIGSKLILAVIWDLDWRTWLQIGSPQFKGLHSYIVLHLFIFALFYIAIFLLFQLAV
jgi:hypothetical protein